jgi:hypothetical protein
MNPENLAPLTVPPPIPQNRGISESDLVCPQEKSRFIILLIVSIAVWLLLAITGVGLFFALLIGLFIWFAGGMLVARLRAESVEITPKQMPELYGPSAAGTDQCVKRNQADRDKEVEVRRL